MFWCVLVDFGVLMVVGVCVQTLGFACFRGCLVFGFTLLCGLFANCSFLFFVGWRNTGYV